MSQRSLMKQAQAISGITTVTNCAGTSAKQNNNQSLQYNSKHYDRIRILGKGSFGTATVHRRKTDCSLVVLKEIDLQKFKGEREKNAAINEARIMSTLDHINIIKYHNAYTTDTKLVIEMEYASMGTLATYVSLLDQALEEQEILGIFRQIASGLNYLHSKNIVHLDLKMANIFVSVEGLIKIGDFSISQYIQSSNESNQQQQQIMKDNEGAEIRKSNSPLSKRLTTSCANSHLGTLAYSSPERCLGEATNFKSDIWSLGCILYELITLKPLFSGDSLAEFVLSITQINYTPIKRNITPTLREVFEQMISIDPNQRPTANELLCITDQLLSHFQLKRHKTMNKRRSNRFELSTEVEFLAANNHDDLGQINYPHSLVYQVRLDSRHIHMDRVNLPQSKRIKEMSKGKSHYLVLTYDNIVYGWGSKNFGQLGACGLSSSNNTSRPRSANSKDSFGRLVSSSAPSSVTSSTQTIVNQDNQQQSMMNKNNNRLTQQKNQYLSKQLVMDMLEESQPSTKPFVINELNHRKIIQVAAGDNFSVFLGKTGIVMTCGDGSVGCLGHGNLKSCFTPSMVESLLNTDVISIACGSEHVVAVCGNGRAFSWGKYSHGRLGISTDRKSRELYFDESGKCVLLPQQVQFPNQVIIKSVYCGDKCTIFIDSKNRCWACGENRFNKLGLDIKRRFKKTIIVDKCFLPTEIDSLNKYKIITCNIGKNHSSFLTSEGKLVVFGQDIDHTYRYRSNIICGRDSHRKISYELQTKRRAHISKYHQYGQRSRDNLKFNIDNNLNNDKNTNLQSIELANMNYKHLTKSSIVHDQLMGFKQSSYNLYGTNKTADNIKYPKIKLSKSQKLQIDSYLKKSRAIKKMPFECVISVNCTSKFTLALTNDNHVYFWGTRSYKREDSFGSSPKNGDEKDWCKHCSSKRSTEPQLVSASSDECFIKIGATNSSLMSNIQILGSDQPIIHAQDPRLKANSLADLWILDYKPSSTDSNSTSSSHISSASSSCSSLSSYVCSSISECSCGSCSKRNINHDDCMKHAAILEPQPIVSLYVPSMFNHNGCSLNLVDLFCFDEDKFYIILDTTIKLQQPNTRHLSSNNLVKNSNQIVNKFKLGSLVEVAGNSSKHSNSKEMSLNTRPSTGHDVVKNNITHCLDTNKREVAEPLEIDCPVKSKKNSFNFIENNPEGVCVNCELDVGNKECAANCDNNNNNNEATGISSSQGGVSLEEPRSLSTFAMGHHIIVGPTMRSLNLLEEEQTLKPLNFNQLSRDQSEVLEADTNINEVVNNMIGVIDNSSKTIDYKDTRHESTACGSGDVDETSSMPSWVRNEYIQQQEDRAITSSNYPIFSIDSSTSDKTPMTSSNGTLDGVEEAGTLEGSSINDREDHHNDNKLVGQTSCLEENGVDANASLSKSFSSASSIKRMPENDEIEEPENTTITFFQCDQQNESRYSESDFTNKIKQPSLFLSQNKTLTTSKSQPDISKQECQVLRSSEVIRRASILNEAQGVTAQSNNILDCNVYRASGQNQHHYESSNFHSILSSLANSQNQLIKSDICGSNLHQQQQLSMLNRSPLADQTSGIQATYPWSAELNMSDTSLQPKSTDENSIIHQRNEHICRHKNLALSQSDAQLHPSHASAKNIHMRPRTAITRMGSKHKASSSSSLASMRRSLMKLFC